MDFSVEAGDLGSWVQAVHFKATGGGLGSCG